MPKYDEPKIAAAQAAWRKQDLKTWDKFDVDSVTTRSDALLDLLCAHVPVARKEGVDSLPEVHYVTSHTPIRPTRTRSCPTSQTTPSKSFPTSYA